MLFTRWDKQQAFMDAMTANGMKPKSVIVWDKKAHSMGDLQRAFGSRYESIIWYAEHDFHFQGKRPVDIIEYPRVSAEKLVHPNEKPIGLLEKLILQTTQAGDTVLDFTMGSGSTGVACVNTGRDFIGIEKDEHYFGVAQKRIADAQKERDSMLFKEGA